MPVRIKMIRPVVMDKTHQDLIPGGKSGNLADCETMRIAAVCFRALSERNHLRGTPDLFRTDHSFRLIKTAADAVNTESAHAVGKIVRRQTPVLACGISEVLRLGTKQKTF